MKHVCIKAEQTPCKLCFMESRSWIYYWYWLYDNILGKYIYLCFSTIQHDKTNHQHNQIGGKKSTDDCTHEAHSKMVHAGTGGSNSSTPRHLKSTSNLARYQQQTLTLPTLLTEITSSQPIKNEDLSNRIPEAANKMICATWSPKAQQKYLSIFNKWDKFCCKKGINTM